MSVPTTINGISGGGGWTSNYVYQRRSSLDTTGHSFYDLYQNGAFVTTTGTHSIKVNNSTNVWSDGDLTSAFPNVVDDNADGNVYVYAATTNLEFSFAKPTGINWSGNPLSSSGTSSTKKTKKVFCNFW